MEAKMENQNLFELLNSSIQSSHTSKVNFSSLYSLLKAMLEQLDNLKGTCKDGVSEVASQQKIAVERCCHRVGALEGTLRSLRDVLQKSPEHAELFQGVQWYLMESDTDQVPSGPPVSPESRVETVMSQKTIIQLTERDTSTQNMEEQLKQQGALIERLMSDREKLDTLEDTVMKWTSSGAASGSVDTDGKVYHELKQQISLLRMSVEKLEDDMKQLKAQQALSEESTEDQQLQDEIQEEIQDQESLNLPKDPSSPPKPSNTTSDPESVSEPAPSEAVDDQPASGTVSKLMERFRNLETLVASLKKGKVDQPQLKQLQDIVNKRVNASKNMTEQLRQQGALIERLMSDREKDLELMNDLQKAILQLQAECEKLNETTRCLQEDNVQKQSHIQELYKTTEELEERKAGKEVLESVMKCDKSSLDSKVSHVQFDSVIEELNALFQELLNKVSGQEQVIERLSSETECKLNRMEFDPVKKQLEERWGWIHKKLQDQNTPESDDAAILRKQLVETFHCLSCDRPIVKNLTGPNSTELPISTYPYSNKSEWHLSFSPQEKFGQDRRSKYFSEQKDYSYPPVSRSCGGKSTITTRPMLFSERKKMRDLRARARKSLLQ
ncbi:uncharacterized protein LOC141809390 [Halichoeres trimaculatus]|uniref:uncharacterized protein LOC141809390 n=1 Tax=Halichoeres trimaculatus TaxID=147232 RepID=UPI003D9E2CB4